MFKCVKKIKTQDQIVEVLILSAQVRLHQVLILSPLVHFPASGNTCRNASTDASFLEEFCLFVFLFNIQELVTYCGCSRV